MAAPQAVWSLISDVTQAKGASQTVSGAIGERGDVSAATT